MRKWLVLAGIILILSISSVFAQNLKVSEIRQVTNLDDGAFFFPQIFPGGDKILVTSSNYNGLYYCNLDGTNIIEISKDIGAGYEPVITSDGNSVIYRISEFKNRRRFSSLIEQELANGQKQLLISEKRNLSTPRISPSDEIILMDNNVPQTVSLQKPGKSLNPQTAQLNTPVVFIENTNIALISDGDKQVFEPMGTGHYIWPSISPDGQKLLFTKMGEATYISDLDGGNPVSLGRANAPRWSPDGNWVVYMDDKDDGYVVLESHIYAISSDGQNRVQLTNSPDRIDMYPVWGNEMDKIVFATDKGEIFLITMETE